MVASRSLVASDSQLTCPGNASERTGGSFALSSSCVPAIDLQAGEAVVPIGSDGLVVGRWG